MESKNGETADFECCDQRYVVFKQVAMLLFSIAVIIVRECFKVKE